MDMRLPWTAKSRLTPIAAAPSFPPPRCKITSADRARTTADNVIGRIDYAGNNSDAKNGLVDATAIRSANMTLPYISDGPPGGGGEEIADSNDQRHGNARGGLNSSAGSVGSDHRGFQIRTIECAPRARSLITHFRRLKVTRTYIRTYIRPARAWRCAATFRYHAHQDGSILTSPLFFRPVKDHVFIQLVVFQALTRRDEESVLLRISRSRLADSIREECTPRHTKREIPVRAMAGQKGSHWSKKGLVDETNIWLKFD